MLYHWASFLYICLTLSLLNRPLSNGRQFYSSRESLWVGKGLISRDFVRLEWTDKYKQPSNWRSKGCKFNSHLRLRDFSVRLWVCYKLEQKTKYIYLYFNTCAPLTWLMWKFGKFGIKSFPTRKPIKIQSSMIFSTSYSNDILVCEILSKQGCYSIFFFITILLHIHVLTHYCFHRLLLCVQYSWKFNNKTVSSPSVSQTPNQCIPSTVTSVEGGTLFPLDCWL